MPMLPWLMQRSGGFMPEIMTRNPQPSKFAPEVLTRQPQPAAQAGPGGNFMPESLTRAPQTAQPAAPQQAGGLLGGGLTPEMGALLALGAGLLQNRDKRVGEGLGAGLMNAMNTYTGLQGQERVRERLDRQDRLEQQKLDQAEAKAKSLEDAIAGLPPDQQSIARANPDAFFDARAKQLFAAPEPMKPPQTRTITQGSEEITQEWDAATGGWNEIGRGGRWQPQQAGGGQGAESWSLVPAEEAEKLGFSPGSVVSRSSRGNYQVEQSPPSKNQGITIGPDGTVTIGGSGGTDPVVARKGIEETRKADATFQTADDALAKLDDRIASKGMAVLPGAEQQETATIYRLALNEMRKLTESGALQKADLEYLESIIQDPTALSAAPQAVGNLVGTGSPTTGTRAQIQAARDYLKNVRDRTKEVYAPGGGTAPSQTAPSAPAVGAVQDGYRFKGGDPASPDSWEPVR